MEAVEKNGSPSESGTSGQVSGEDEAGLQLQLHTDEAVWMRQIGHLKDWCSSTRSVKLGIPARVTTNLAADSLRLLWLFQNLHCLDITFNSTRTRIEQSMVVACAELLNLTSLQLVGGHLPRRGLDLGVLTSLRRLRSLAVRPHSDEELDGLEDEHLAGAARLTGLTSLSLRASENVTDEGAMALTALTALTQLSLVPMGLCVTREGVAALSAALPSLEAFAVGLHESRQVAALKGMLERPRPRTTSPAGEWSGAASAASAPFLTPSAPAISLVLNSPEVSTSGFFSTLTLVLRPRLVSLRMATVESTDPSFLLAVGTLAHLTELKMGVSMPEGGQPFTCNLAALSSLGQLRTLEFAVTAELRLPLSVKMVSLLALSWPRLCSLSLSVMAKLEVAPEALDLLDNFQGLTSLSLFAPLDYCSDEDPSAIELPVNLRYLPRGLTNLVLECAHLQDHHQISGAVTGNGAGPLPLSPQSTREGGGADSRVPTPGSVLSHLEQLELNSCRASDDSLSALLGSATGLRHLELTDVVGISDTALSALHGLTRLEHLVVRLTGDASGRDGGGAVSHRSLTALRHASTLRHLEWSLPEPLQSLEVEALSGVLMSLGGLQELYLDVAPELRGAAGQGPGTRHWSSGDDAGGTIPEGRNGGGVAGSASGSAWREQLQQALPLCTFAEHPSIVLYDLWNDRTVQLVGS